MKRHIASLCTIALAIGVSGCTTTSEVRPITLNTGLNKDTPQGIAFSLPKTIFELEITYGLNEIKTDPLDAQGKKGTPTTVRKIQITKPIALRTVTVPDYSASFVFDPSSLDGITKNTDITLDLIDGMIKSTNIIVNDETDEMVGNAVKSIANVAISAAVAGATEKVVETTQLQEITVTRQIDPDTLSFDQKDNKWVAKYDGIVDAGVLFGTKLTAPKVSFRVVSSTDWDKRQHCDKAKTGKTENNSANNNDGGANGNTINGIPYRVGDRVEAQILVNNRVAYSGYHTVKQRGGFAVIPLTAKWLSDVTQGISFGDDGAGITKYSSKGTSSGKALTLATSEATSSVKQALIDKQQAKQDMLKKEIKATEAGLEQSDSLASIEAELALINKKVELAEAKAKLAEAESKLEEDAAP